jgi:hypothetical protein
MESLLDNLQMFLRTLAGAGALALTAATSTGCIAYAVVDEPVVVEAADAPATVEVFNDGLSPYGEWVEVGAYGRVWHPSVAVVGPDFTPYTTGGQWVSTDQGWAFESSYSWGWAPFHYGRWVVEAGYGWVWVPDTVWAPAWVEWRYGGGYVGWAPMGPGYVTAYAPAFTFVETAHFVAGDCAHHRLPAERVNMAYASTVAVHDQVGHGGARWNAGPRVDMVEHEVGAPIQRVRVNAPRPGYVVKPQASGALGYHAGSQQPAATRQSAPVQQVTRDRGDARSWSNPAPRPQARDERAQPEPFVNHAQAPGVNPGFRSAPAARSTPVAQPAPMARPAPVSRPAAPVSRPASRVSAPSRTSSRHR